MKKIDVFDFDKTLYRKDCSIQFFLYCLQKKFAIVKYIPGIIILYLLNLFKLIKKKKLKEYYFKFLNDFNPKETKKLVSDFWKRNEKHIRHELLKKSENEKVVISASPEFLIKDICNKYNVDTIIASKVDIRTGKFNSLNCYGKEKVKRLNKKYKNYLIENFYSDSYSDNALASISSKAYMVNNNQIIDWNFSKLNRFINGIINKMYFIVMVIILACCFFFSNVPYACRKEFEFNNNISLIVGIVFFLILLFFIKRSKPKKLKQKHLNILMIAFSIFLTFVLYFRAKNFWFLTGWDASVVRGTANFIAIGQPENIWNAYFSNYQNNIFISIIFSWVIRLSNLFKVADFNSSLLFFNCTLFSLSGMLLFFNINKLTKNNYVSSMFGYVIYILLIAFSPWIVIPYSDSLALLMVMLGLFLFLKYEDKNKNKTIYFFLFCLICFFGLKIKPQIFILFVSFIIIKISRFNLKNIKLLFTKKALINFLIVIASLSIVLTVTTYSQNKYFNIDKEKNFGIANYLMWGFNYRTRGVYPSEDVTFSGSFETNKERTEANLKVVGERIRHLGFKGVVELYRDKILTNFNDGTFAWECEGNFYTQMYNNEKTNYMRTLENYYYSGGTNNWIFNLTMQIIWITTLFLSFIFSFKKNFSNKISVLKLSIIGLFIFELLFEARARYIFSYIPMFIILMCLLIANINNKNYREENKD